MLNEPAYLSYWTRGRTAERKPDLLIDEETDTVTQRKDEVWDDSSDHTPLLYGIRDVALTIGRRKNSKKML